MREHIITFTKYHLSSYLWKRLNEVTQHSSVKVTTVLVIRVQYVAMEFLGCTKSVLKAKKRIKSNSSAGQKVKTRVVVVVKV